MTRTERVRYEMLLRVRDFGKTHQNLFPETSMSGRKALAIVARAIEEIEVHETARQIAARETWRDKAARRKTILARMRSIAQSSRHVVVESGARMRLRMPQRVADVAVAEAARRFVTLAEAHHDQFVSLGLPPTCLSDLREAITAFEASLADRRVGRAGVAAASAGIRAALTAGAQAVQTIDIVVRNSAGDDAAVAAAWERDRRIVEGIGKAQHRAPVAPPVVAEPIPDVPNPAETTAAGGATSGAPSTDPARKAS